MSPTDTLAVVIGGAGILVGGLILIGIEVADRWRRRRPPAAPS